jgi:hypothetical protein
MNCLQPGQATTGVATAIVLFQGMTIQIQGVILTQGILQTL